MCFTDGMQQQQQQQDGQLQHSNSCSLDKSWFIETCFLPASVEKGDPDVQLPQLHPLRPDTHLSVRREPKLRLTLQKASRIHRITLPWSTIRCCLRSQTCRTASLMSTLYSYQIGWIPQCTAAVKLSIQILVSVNTRFPGAPRHEGIRTLGLHSSDFIGGILRRYFSGGISAYWPERWQMVEKLRETNGGNMCYNSLYNC